MQNDNIVAAAIHWKEIKRNLLKDKPIDKQKNCAAIPDSLSLSYFYLNTTYIYIYYLYTST